VDVAIDIYTKKYVSSDLVDAVSLSASDASLLVVFDCALLPLAANLKRKFGIPFIYEAREYYEGQNARNLFWRFIYPKVIRNLHCKYVHDAKAVTTVSEGISHLMRNKYKTKEGPIVVLGFPKLKPNLSSRDLLKPFKMVFHGNLTPDREIHTFIKKNRKLLSSGEIHLTIRGNGSEEFI
jgi:hypothetical protein